MEAISWGAAQLQAIALFNAALVGLTALIRSILLPSSISLRFAAGLLILVAAVLAVISVNHSAHRLVHVDLIAIESAIALMTGPILCGLILALVGRSTSLPILFGPAVLFTIVATGLGGFEGRLFSIQTIVPIQVSYTILSWIALFRFGDADGESTRLAVWILSTASLIHVTQLIRFVDSLSWAGNELVPATIGAAMLGLTVRCVWLGTPMAISTVAKTPKSIDPEKERVFSRVKMLLETDRIYLDPSLRLPVVAQMIGESSKSVSTAISGCTGKNFSSLIRRTRIAHAKRLLADPNESRTSIEAISLMSGFKSRSAFYRAFSTEMGVTPTDYRAERQSSLS